MTEATNNARALLPCPLCGSTDVEIDGKPVILDALDSVSCNQCTAGAPIHAWQGCNAPPAAAVVMPAYRHMSEDLDAAFVEGYNSALDEVAHLNPASDDSEHALEMVVPEGWREFVAECAGMAGGMVNGNQLSLRAQELLAAAPAPEPASRAVLVNAARRVLDGLIARLDAAVEAGDPLPVFDGIAELHDALAAPEQPAKEQGHE